MRKILPLAAFFIFLLCISGCGNKTLNLWDCQNDCKTKGYFNGNCVMSLQASANLHDNGKCLVNNFDGCNDAKSCRCYCYYEQTEADIPKPDDITVFLNLIKTETGLFFSLPHDTTFNWNILKDNEVKPLELSGKVTKASDLELDQSVLKSFFTKQGFNLDKYNLAAGTIAGITGYQKDDFVCLVSLKSPLDTITNEPKLDLIDLEISCAKIPPEPEYLSLSKFMEAPQYDKDVKISGYIQPSQEENCSCFELTENNVTLRIDYSQNPDSVKGFELKKMQHVILTGQLKSGGSNFELKELKIVE